MDQDVINLAKAIRDKESKGNFNAVGDAGTSKGGYQWQKGTWQEHAKKILGDSNAQMTPDNQNAVAYGMIKNWKDQGLNPAQIAAKWNSGSSTGWENKIGTTTINGKKIAYNVPQYVKDVTDTYQKYKMTNQVIKAPEKSAGEMADISSAEKYKATFPSKSEGTAVGEAIRTVGNIPGSAFGFVKGALDIINPVSTVNKIKEIVSGTKEFAQEQGGMGKAIWEVIKQTPETAYEVLVPEVARKVISGDLEEAQRAIVNDPVGQILPFIIAAKGGAKVADTAATKSAMAKYAREPFTQKTIPKPTTKYSEAVDTTISKVGQAGMQPFKSAFGGAGKVRDYAISQATGLAPETIRTVKETPKAFSKKAMADIDRATLGRQVQSKLGQLAEEKSATGKEYQPIRESGKEVKVDPTFWDDTFKETTGLEIKKGQLTPTTTSKVRDAGDVRALQKVYEFWKPKFKEGKLTADEYLNMREDLAKASKFEKDLGKRKDVEILAGQIRAKLNQAYRPQVEGLSALDETMRSQILEYKDLAKGLVDKDGIITDAGMAKIANLSKNKPKLAEQLERIVPGITQQVKVLQAIADIERASGIKVGTYTRAAATGGAFLGGGPVAAIVTAVLTSPEVAVPLLRQYGLIKNATVVKAVTNALRESVGFVNKLPEKIPANSAMITGGNKSNFGR